MRDTLAVGTRVKVIGEVHHGRNGVIIDAPKDEIVGFLDGRQFDYAVKCDGFATLAFDRDELEVVE